MLSLLFWGERGQERTRIFFTQGVDVHGKAKLCEAPAEFLFHGRTFLSHKPGEVHVDVPFLVHQGPNNFHGFTPVTRTTLRPREAAWESPTRKPSLA